MPVHPAVRLPILVAASAAAYAASLAWVSGMQASQDAAAARATRPLAEAAADAASMRSGAQAAADAATGALAEALGEYELTTRASAELDAQLAELASMVTEVTGAAARLPATVPLPAVPSAVVRQVVVQPPATQGTTGASGR
jgi:hypothetical protein